MSEINSSTKAPDSDSGDSRTSSSHASTPERTLAKCLTRVWELMSSRYAERWTARRGEHWDGVTWVEDMQGLTPDEFAQAMRLDLERGETWPPSAPQFREMAKRGSREPAHQRFQALPPPMPARERVALRWKSYQQFYGLKSWGMTEEAMDAALADSDIEQMHQQVRDIRRAAGLANWREWPAS